MVTELARKAKQASRILSCTPTDKKNAALRRAATLITGSHRDAILRANDADVAAAQKNGISAAMLDRLRLDGARLQAVANGVLAVAELPDPVGQTVEERTLPNRLHVKRIRAPLGVIAIIYESRPNVTADAAALCLKSGNACILRGGSEAFETNKALAAAFNEALLAESIPEAAVTLIPTTDRAATLELISLDELVDLVIPRGGESLIRFVAENSRVPVIRHYKGVCHVYVDGSADLDMALRIAMNAKTHRPGVCNAMETLLIDEACVNAFLPRVADALITAGVEIRGDAAVCRMVPTAKRATPETWDTEYLALILSVAVVNGLDGALAHIAAHGTQHTEAIVTNDPAKADRFLREVDASLVLWNASTRFNDGGELGLGAEMGISTTKIHAYGAMGLNELCTVRWIAIGDGQVRG